MGSFLPAIVSFDEQRYLLCMTGDEDRATQSLRRRPLSRALLAGRQEVTVDLTGLSFADASLMLDLAMLARRLRHAGGRVVLCGAQPHIQRLIELVGLDRFPGVAMGAAQVA
jgi:anti-anti-sigma factor